MLIIHIGTKKFINTSAPKQAWSTKQSAHGTKLTAQK
jgi:hypothetical protein